MTSQATTYDGSLGSPFEHPEDRELLAVIDESARRQGLHIDRAAVRHELGERSGVDDGDARLTRAAKAAGLEVRRVKLPLSRASAESWERTPLFTQLRVGDRRRWVALLGGSKSRVLVREIAAGVEREWTLQSLAQSLGVGVDDAGTEWVVMPVEAPLGGASAAHEGGHTGGHHPHPPPSERLWSILRAERRDVGVAATYAAAVGLLTLAVPITVQALVNTVSFGVLRQPIVVLTLLVLLGLGFAGAMRAAQSLVVEALQQRLFVRTAIDTAYRLPRADIESFDREHGPELVNRFFDVLTLQKGLAQLLLDALALALQLVVGATLLAFYHPALLAFDALLLIVLGVIVVVLGLGATSTSIAESKAKYAVAAWLEELAMHPLAFHTAGGRRLATARIEGLASNYVEARRAHFAIVLRQTVALLALQALANAALLGVGAVLVLEGQLTLGQLVAAELVASAMLAGTAKLGKHLETYYDLLSAADKLGHLIDIPLERERGEARRSTGEATEISVRGATIARGEHEVLGGVDLTIARGERVALEGRSGAGKSTLIDTLFGLRGPRAGVVLIDGVDVRELDLASLREGAALVRGVELFAGTVAENVRAGRREVTHERVCEALKAVDLFDAVLQLPNGLQETLTTGGAPLSDEQTRRLMLARALAGRPRLLLLDEALDAIDEVALAQVQRAIFDEGRGQTVVLATRRADLAARCDRAVRVADGQLNEVSDAAKGGRR